MSMFSSERPDKSITRTCWIITGDLDVVKVKAFYKAETSMWGFELIDKNKSINTSFRNLRPYFPTLGNGNGSYWGDGPQYKTKAAAKLDQAGLIKKKIREVKACFKKEAEIKVNELVQKLK